MEKYDILLILNTLVRSKIFVSGTKEIDLIHYLQMMTKDKSLYPLLIFQKCILHTVISFKIMSVQRQTIQIWSVGSWSRMHWFCESSVICAGNMVQLNVRMYKYSVFNLENIYLNPFIIIW